MTYKSRLNRMERIAPPAADQQAAAAVADWFAMVEAGMSHGDAEAAQRALSARYNGQLAAPGDGQALATWEQRMRQLAPDIMGQFDVTAGDMMAELDRLEAVLR